MPIFHNLRRFRLLRPYVTMCLRIISKKKPGFQEKNSVLGPQNQQSTIRNHQFLYPSMAPAIPDRNGTSQINHTTRLNL
jgi:hypothetical protein